MNVQLEPQAAAAAAKIRAAPRPDALAQCGHKRSRISRASLYPSIRLPICASRHFSEYQRCRPLVLTV